MKRIIWSNRNLNIDDWRDVYREFCKMNDIDISNKNDDDIYDFMYETNNDYLEDERMNLNISTEGRILVIADLGLWNRRRNGYKICNICNVNQIFSCIQGDYVEYYFDGHNIKASDSHHDGTNYYEFREIREDTSFIKLLNAILNGEDVTRQMINRYTRSLGRYCKQVYGW